MSSKQLGLGVGAGAQGSDNGGASPPPRGGEASLPSTIPKPTHKRILETLLQRHAPHTVSAPHSPQPLAHSATLPSPLPLPPGPSLALLQPFAPPALNSLPSSPPSPVQVDDATLQKELQARGGPGEVNLWSGRRLGPSGPPAGGPPGGRGDRRREASKYRCVLELDVGRTRGSDAGQHMFCIYFAK